MIQQLLEHLGLTIARREAAELVCICPVCNSDSLSVNSQTGAWQCFHGCGQGHPYQLVKLAKPDLQPRQIFQLLQKLNLNAPETKARRDPKPKVLRIKEEEIADLQSSEIESFCQIKNINQEAFLKLRPKRHAKMPWVLLPAFNPQSPDKPVGYIRAGIDGSSVEIKYKDPNSGEIKTKQERYPVVPGSSFGLLGLHTITDDCEELVFAEGWRDCTAAISLGFQSVCNLFGAGKWDDSWLPVFKDKIVYIIGDRDTAGVKGAQKVAPLIIRVAKEVRIVELPYELTKSKGKDLHDYVREDKHTKEDLTLLLQTAPVYVAASESDNNQQEADENSSREGVIVLPDDHPDTIAAAFEEWSVQKCQVRHRYHIADGWTIYKDGKYQSVDPKVQVAKYLCDFIKNVYVPGKGKKVKPARYKISNLGISNILQQLSFQDNVYLRPKQIAPCSLDESLDSQNIIAFNNCLLDISSKPYKEISLTEDFYTLTYLDYDWEGVKVSEKWVNFIVEVCNRNEQLVNLLSQWCGYLLMPSQQFQKFLICYGEGANGKGVFFDIIRAVLGESNCSCVPMDAFLDTYGLTATYGKRINQSDESTKNMEEKAEAVIKRFTGGNVVQFRRIYEAPFEAYPTAKLMFSCNDLPRFPDASNGIWRRMLLCPFSAKFEGKENFDLAEELKEELSSIVCFFLEGLHLLRSDGRFIEPDLCREEKDKYRSESNPSRGFLLENFRQVDDEFRYVTVGDLRKTYRKWCEDHGYQPKNDSNLGRDIQRVFPKIEKKRKDVFGKRLTVYTCMDTLPESEYSYIIDNKESGVLYE